MIIKIVIDITKIIVFISVNDDINKFYISRCVERYNKDNNDIDSNSNCISGKDNKNDNNDNKNNNKRNSNDINKECENVESKNGITNFINMSGEVCMATPGIK